MPALQENSPLSAPAPSFSNYVEEVQRFLGIPDALERTGLPAAFADRSGGNLSRPHYPDGVASKPHGPLSKASGEWSVFSVGLQLDLVYNSLVQHVAHVALDGAIPDVTESCPGNTGFDVNNLFQQQGGAPQLANGIQIFPGSVPIFRGETLVGGIGVSGDGVDQDDMISFLGVHRAGLRLDKALNNAPPQSEPIRSIYRTTYPDCATSAARKLPISIAMKTMSAQVFSNSHTRRRWAPMSPKATVNAAHSTLGQLMLVCTLQSLKINPLSRSCVFRSTRADQLPARPRRYRASKTGQGRHSIRRIH